jgi:hypothetical protein
VKAGIFVGCATAHLSWEATFAELPESSTWVAVAVRCSTPYDAGPAAGVIAIATVLVQVTDEAVKAWYLLQAEFMALPE